MSLSYLSPRLRQDGAFQAGNAPYDAQRISTGFDHVTEMRQSVVALGRSINTLKGSLQNPNLSPAAQRVLENQLRVAERNREAMQRTLRSGKNSQ
jgi:hypothetical protein